MHIKAFPVMLGRKTVTRNKAPASVPLLKHVVQRTASLLIATCEGRRSTQSPARFEAIVRIVLNTRDAGRG